jgi:transposase-like protein
LGEILTVFVAEEITMAINAIQFQKGMSMIEFQRRFGTEAQCQEAFEKARWPSGFECPACSGTAHSTFLRSGRKYWQCTTCRQQTTVRAGTLLQASKLSLRQWLLAMFLVTQSKNNVSALELKRQVGVAWRTAWLLKHKLMEAMASREATRQLGHEVEIDDAYLGGERTGGKRGRGSENKVPFVAAVETRDGRPFFVRFDPVPGFTQASLAEWAKEALMPGSHVTSDGLSGFASVTTAGCTHEPIVVGGGKQAACHPRFKWVNTLLGNLKTALSGTYHAFAFAKYARHYLGEYQYRFNRRFDLASMVTRLARAAMLASPCTAKQIIRPAEPCR